MSDTISHPAEPMRVGSLVRWSEFPDRLYFIEVMPYVFCGNPNCAKIRSIDNAHCGIVPISQLTLDDVDYDEPQTKHISREEEIKAKAVEIQQEYYDGYYSGHIESYQQTAIDAAMWADKTMIEKACEWLKEHGDTYTWYNEMEGESGLTDEFIGDFKKAMEE